AKARTTALHWSDLRAAHRLDEVALRARVPLPRRAELEVLGPDADRRLRRLARRPPHEWDLELAGARDERAVLCGDLGVEEVHRRRPDELRDEAVRRPRVELGGRRVRLQTSVAHDRDAVGHR